MNADGWYRPQGYGGCRNCMFRGEGLPMCRRAAEAKASIPVCPFWQRREQEKGDEDGKPQEGFVQQFSDLLRSGRRTGVERLELSDNGNLVTICFEGGGRREVNVECDSEAALILDVIRRVLY